MARKRHSPEQISNKLRAIGAHLAAGMTQAPRPPTVRRSRSISDLRWRKGYGGLKVDQAEVEKENADSSDWSPS